MDFVKDGGYVRVELLKDNGDGFKQNVLNKMYKEIQKLISENNYEYKDITILCNSRKRVSLVAEFLSENGMNVVSNEGLLIHSSEKVRLVVDVLRYLIDINDDISKLSIINYLHKKPKSENLKFSLFKNT